MPGKFMLILSLMVALCLFGALTKSVLSRYLSYPGLVT